MDQLIKNHINNIKHLRIESGQLRDYSNLSRLLVFPAADHIKICKELNTVVQDVFT